MPGFSFSMAFPSLRGYHAATHRIQTSIERLSTGKRINRAADDPAGLVGITTMKTDRVVIDRKLESIERENHWLAAREGALSAMGQPLAELVGLVTTAANRDALDDTQLEAIQIEADSILDGIDHISANAIHNGQYLFPGSSTQSMGLDKFRSGGEYNLIDGDLEAAQQQAEAALNANAEKQAAIGAKMKDNASHTNTLLAELEALTGEISRIEDTDYAKEISELVRNQVLQQAALAMTAIGHQSASTVLELIEATSKTPQSEALIPDP